MFKFLVYLGVPLVLIISIATSHSKDSPAALMESHLWESPVLVVAANDDDAGMAAMAAQMDAVQQMARDDVAVYEVIHRGYVKRNGRVLPHVIAASFLAHLDIASDRFTLALYRTDGEEDHRHDAPVSAEALSAMIDKLHAVDADNVEHVH